MILPKHILENLDYFEYTTMEKHYTIHDIFILHFKQWWRKKKVIKIRRIGLVDENDKSVTIFTPSPSADQLYELLNQQMIDTYKKPNIKDQVKSDGTVIDAKNLFENIDK